MTTRRAFIQGTLAAAAATATTVSRARAAPPSVTPKKILILGGTKFIGPAIVAAARARGHTITLFNRGKTNPGLFTDLEQLHGDRDGKLDALRGRKWDAVIDDSGYVPRHVKDSATLLAPSVQHYLFVSTISVYADGSKPIDESSALAKLDKPTEEVTPQSYGALKVLCEQAAAAAAPNKVSVVRPGLIVGPDDPSDRFTYWPVRVARGGEVLAPGTPDDPISYIDVRDLAAFMVAVVEKRLLGTYNATGPATQLSIGSLLDACKRASGSDAKLTWVDAPFLEKEKVTPWGDMPVWVPPIDDGAYLGRINRDKAIKAGLTFRPVVDTCRDTLAWWNKQPAERRATLKAGIKPEREREVLAAWHAKK
jgi:2'-hydroxyisoflavone reductase